MSTSCEKRDGGGRTERLLDLLARGDETEVDERGDGHARHGVPPKEVDELEREEEEVDPHGAVAESASAASMQDRDTQHSLSDVCRVHAEHQRRVSQR